MAVTFNLQSSLKENNLPRSSFLPAPHVTGSLALGKLPSTPSVLLGTLSSALPCPSLSKLSTLNDSFSFKIKNHRGRVRS